MFLVVVGFFLFPKFFGEDSSGDVEDRARRAGTLRRWERRRGSARGPEAPRGRRPEVKELSWWERIRGVRDPSPASSEDWGREEEDEEDHGFAMSDTDLEDEPPPPRRNRRGWTRPGRGAEEESGEEYGLDRLRRRVAESRRVQTTDRGGRASPAVPPLPPPPAAPLQTPTRAAREEDGGTAPATPSSRGATGGSGASQAGDPETSVLRNSVEGDRELALFAVEKQDDSADLQLPIGVKTRIAKTVIIRLFRQYTPIEEVELMITTKELQGSRYARELREWARTLLDMIRAKQDVVNTRTGERVCRKLHSYWRGFERVERRSDWKAPKGAGPAWKSKIDWRMIREIDLNLMAGDSDRIPALEEEVGSRLSQQSQLQGSLERAGDNTAPDLGDD